MEDQQTGFEIGDELATAGDRVALEYGWWADGWIEAEAKRADADPTSRAAFSYALDVLENRHGQCLSRSQITDRIRIGRAFPKQVYSDLELELHYKFTFSQLRAAYIRDDEKRTMELLLWTAENDAFPIEINAKKMGEAVETDEDKAWRHLVEWADKYVFRGAGKNAERDALARSILEYDRKERSEYGKKEEDCCTLRSGGYCPAGRVHPGGCAEVHGDGEDAREEVPA